MNTFNSCCISKYLSKFHASYKKTDISLCEYRQTNAFYSGEKLDISGKTCTCRILLPGLVDLEPGLGGLERGLRVQQDLPAFLPKS